jgi:hypothetical protein
MAAHNSSKATPAATLGKTPVPCHQHDDWLLPAAKLDHNAQFASNVMDIARGTRVIASILCAHLVDLNAISAGAGDSVRTLLSENDTEALARLAVLSLDHLYEMSAHHVDTLNTKAEARAKA